MDDYSRLARLEWFQTICFNFPVQIILPFVVLFQRPGLFIPVLISMGAQLAALLALYFALATVVSLMVNLFRARLSGVSVTRNVDEYVGLLAKASEHERSRLSYFHPSLRRRIAEVQNKFQVLRRAVGWRVYIGLASLVAFIQWKALQDSETDSRYFFCGFLMGLFILFTEMFRGMLLPRASLGSVPLVNSAEEGPVFSEKFTWNEQKPNKALNTIFRYAFLIGGFILATILGANFPNPHVVIPILGALVYGTFRALK